MNPETIIGKHQEFHHRVQESEIVSRVLSNPECALTKHGLPVLASAFLVGIMENYCWEILRPYIEKGEQGIVGKKIHLDHVGPAVPGDLLAVSVKCTNIDTKKNKMNWEIFATNTSRDHQAAGHASHILYMVDINRFLEKLEAGKSTGVKKYIST